MKTSCLKEQKAFALIREILGIIQMLIILFYSVVFINIFTSHCSLGWKSFSLSLASCLPFRCRARLFRGRWNWTELGMSAACSVVRAWFCGKETHYRPMRGWRKVRKGRRRSTVKWSWYQKSSWRPSLEAIFLKPEYLYIIIYTLLKTKEKITSTSIGTKLDRSFYLELSLLLVFSQPSHLFLDRYSYSKRDRLKLQHVEVAWVNSLALVSQSLAKHLLNLISDNSSKHSCSLFWTAVLILSSHVLSLLVFFPAYLGFLWMLLLVAYGQRDPNSYYLNKHIENSFTDGFHDVYSYQDFFTWANTTLVKNLYGSYKGAESCCFTSACQILKHSLFYISLTCTCISDWRKRPWVHKASGDSCNVNTSG